jgi:prepilin-type N-terminal cleavage/methylation domain-containing protein
MSPPLIPGERFACKAFTLIELLTVIAIIGILAAITFGVVRGVGEQSKRNVATSELAVVSNGLEAYRHHFGDYPWVGNDTAPAQLNPGASGFSPAAGDRAYNLFRALAGRLAPKRNTSNNGGIVQRQIDKDGTMVDKYGKSFIDITLFTLEREDEGDPPNGVNALPEPNANPTGPDPDFANALLDPWGNRYLYFYKDQTTNASARLWKASAYVLYSAGPDGLADAPSSAGVLPPATGINADNIYAKP